MRQEIKNRAKQLLRGNYWPCVAVCAIVYGILYAVSGCTFAVAGILISGPLTVGMAQYFIRTTRGEQARIQDVFNGFSNFGHNLGGYLWMELFVFLWSLLFIIPGIIKMYAYYFTPYILADCPNVRATDAIKISMHMTQGHKGEIFVMHLSFIGWSILSSLTFGVVGVFYAAPYIELSMAGLYDRLRALALSEGRVTEDMLTGVVAP